VRKRRLLWCQHAVRLRAATGWLPQRCAATLPPVMPPAQREGRRAYAGSGVARWRRCRRKLRVVVCAAGAQTRYAPCTSSQQRRSMQVAYASPNRSESTRPVVAAQASPVQ